MSRARVADALLALVAVAAVIAPVRPLFTPGSWIPMALLLGVAVSVTGLIARSFTRRDVSVVLWQLGVGVILTCWIFVADQLWYGLPGWQAVLALNDLLYEARITITTYAPPAPSNAGIILAMSILTWLTVLVVDALAVTRRSPALAGIPLLAAFLVSASNSGSGMPVWYFVAAALAWLALLGRSGVFLAGRWDAGGPRGVRTLSSSRASARRLAASGQVVGVSAIVVAALVAALLPHLPTRFLLDGLGRAEGSAGNSGSLTINSTINLARSLEGRSTAPLIRFTSTATSPPPLRIGMLDTYADGVWSVDRSPSYIDGLPGADRAEAERTETVDVTMNGLGAPQLALPHPATSLEIDTGWQSTADGTVRVERRVDAYTADYLIEAPSEGVLQAAVPWRAAGGEVTDADLLLDPESYPLVAAVLGGIVDPGMSQIDIARAIQAHLRGSEYTYSLELAEPLSDEAGGAISNDPISHFLRTQTGFCVQFTATMVMMARAAGIPARFVIGFLPGTPGDDDGERVIAGADAHAWPELFFEGAGWLRFEPTPGTRTGAAPDYTRVGYGTSPDAPTPTQTPGATSAPGIDRPIEPPVDDVNLPGTQGASSNSVLTFIASHGWLALVLLLGILGAATMPLTAWWERRRRRREAADDETRVEVIWQDLLERLDDVGVTPPPDASPRQAGTHIRGNAFLTQETRAALQRVVAAVEQARYAPPVATLDPDRIGLIERDAQAVSTSVVGALQRTDRVRATWWPAAGVTAWRRLATRVDTAIRDRGRSG